MGLGRKNRLHLGSNTMLNKIEPIPSGNLPPGFDPVEGCKLIRKEKILKSNAVNELLQIIMSGVPQSNASSQASRGTKRKWVPEEDAALVSYMVDLHNVGTFNADTGFKAGYLNELEKMLEKALPNTMLKAKPNIESRIRLLKREWSIVYDMLNGQNNSGFGWDEHRQLVVAEDAVWDSYLKSRRSRSIQTSYFPLLYARDRATGKDAQTAADVLEEINAEDVPTTDMNEERNSFYDYEADVSLDDMDVFATEPRGDRDQGGSSSSNKKKKKSDARSGQSSMTCLMAKTIAVLVGTSIGSSLLLKMRHKEAAQFRHRTFPYYNQLTAIYTRDRATGKNAQTAADVLEEINAEDVPTTDMNEERNSFYDCEADVSLDDMDVSATEPRGDRDQGGSSSSNKKKKKSDAHDNMSSSFNEAATLLAKNMRAIGDQIKVIMGWATRPGSTVRSKNRRVQIKFSQMATSLIHFDKKHISAAQVIRADVLVLERTIYNLAMPSITELRGYLQEAGFLHTSCMLDGWKLDPTLISALVERWRPEIHTFHLPCDECTITLENVALQLSLSVDGSIVTRSIIVPGKENHCVTLFGKVSNSFKGGWLCWSRCTKSCAGRQNRIRYQLMVACFCCSHRPSSDYHFYIFDFNGCHMPYADTDIISCIPLKLVGQSMNVGLEYIFWGIDVARILHPYADFDNVTYTELDVSTCTFNDDNNDAVTDPAINANFNARVNDDVYEFWDTIHLHTYSVSSVQPSSIKVEDTRWEARTTSHSSIKEGDEDQDKDKDDGNDGDKGRGGDKHNDDDGDELVYEPPIIVVCIDHPCNRHPSLYVIHSSRQR
ncbi:hypothetical protein GOBAR_DD09654 [Gossypium barbadense]|nr:hypothetical protein GOBAR_DD09654 [Gossypium barbadense]